MKVFLCINSVHALIKKYKKIVFNCSYDLLKMIKLMVGLNLICYAVFIRVTNKQKPMIFYFIFKIHSCTENNHSSMQRKLR